MKRGQPREKGQDALSSLAHAVPEPPPAETHLRIPRSPTLPSNTFRSRRYSAPDEADLHTLTRNGQRLPHIPAKGSTIDGTGRVHRLPQLLDKVRQGM